MVLLVQSKRRATRKKRNEAVSVLPDWNKTVENYMSEYTKARLLPVLVFISDSPVTGHDFPREAGVNGGQALCIIAPEHHDAFYGRYRAKLRNLRNLEGDEDEVLEKAVGTAQHIANRKRLLEPTKTNTQATDDNGDDGNDGSNNDGANNDKAKEASKKRQRQATKKTVKSRKASKSSSEKKQNTVSVKGRRGQYNTLVEEEEEDELISATTPSQPKPTTQTRLAPLPSRAHSTNTRKRKPQTTPSHPTGQSRE
eukprot:TRINITY_DN1176_c0_g2_i3.p2 TRINITY_DN1176_c0_g2~~TRINITY_DN1176_c0_g2_i3.p2  ORF type:complete len:254 (-),score=57.75 TRINITY_DN1176_c0_g2_i3:47-808(-)